MFRERRVGLVGAGVGAGGEKGRGTKGAGKREGRRVALIRWCVVSMGKL